MRAPVHQGDGLIKLVDPVAVCQLIVPRASEYQGLTKYRQFCVWLALGLTREYEGASVYVYTKTPRATSGRVDMSGRTVRQVCTSTLVHVSNQ